MCLREFALEVGRQPDASQRPGLGQECLRIKHCTLMASGGEEWQRRSTESVRGGG